MEQACDIDLSTREDKSSDLVSDASQYAHETAPKFLFPFCYA